MLLVNATATVPPELVEGSLSKILGLINTGSNTMSFWVYILKCKDDSYYTGHTDNLGQRVNQHQYGYFSTCYTASRLPVELVFSQPFASREEALISERRIKGWSRKKKEAMIRGDWGEVSRLAKSADPSTSSGGAGYG
jgi:putative endonuclease